MKKILLILSICLFLVSCRTPYQSTGFTGGFSETQLSENMFKVNFRGSGFTSRERVNDFNLLRCAELTKQNDYNYFVIIGNSEHTNVSTSTMPTYTKTKVSVYGNTGEARSTTTGGQTITFRKPSNSNTIVCYKDKPEGISYNAGFIIKSIKKKYDITD